MPRTSTLKNAADKLLAPTGLDEWLTKRSAEGLSWEAIGRELAADTDGIIVISYRTIGRWLEELEQAS